MTAPLVSVENLSVEYRDGRRWVQVVRGVSLDIGVGESVGLAGESGCGKSTTAFALFGYRRPGSRVVTGSVRFDGEDLLMMSPRRLAAVRGRQIGVVLQNPASSLTPSMRVGRQLIETLKAHGEAPGNEVDRAKELFLDVGLPDPDRLMRSYPHQLSGGQQQRVGISIALACRPRLLVLDEPTTALDATTQIRILQLLDRLRREREMSMLYVTHNLGVLAQLCERTAIMYAGELVEMAPTSQLFAAPVHPYTAGLLAAVPRLEEPPDTSGGLVGLLNRDALPPGCPFAPRCPQVAEECSQTRQHLQSVGADHTAACWRWDDISVRGALGSGQHNAS